MDCSCDDIDDDPDIVERDPSGRYVRYGDVLGEGEYKTVYKGFDEVDGIEVAWNQIELSPEITNCPKLLKSLCDEAVILKSLKHENVMRCYHSWVDVEQKRINMITELFTSGDLQHYCQKHTHLDRKPIKNWCKQILKALSYLHGHNPPIIHRDLKCGNIFVNGNSGKVKIGDLGLAVEFDSRVGPRRSVTGTPGFMAPEVYEEEYDERVDVYAFGMCLLEMVVHEEPYHECQNHAQVYNKVRNGVKPVGLSKVRDSQVRGFIEKCLAPVGERPSALDLLNDPFITGEMERVRVGREGDEKTTVRLYGKVVEARHEILMTLRLGSLRNEYKYSLESDTVESVVEEMIKEVDEISSEDGVVISELMQEVIAGLVGVSSENKEEEVNECNTNVENKNEKLKASPVEDQIPQVQQSRRPKKRNKLCARLLKMLLRNPCVNKF